MIGRAGNAVGQLGFYDLDKRLEAISAKGAPLEALWEKSSRASKSGGPVREPRLRFPRAASP
jgi:hypothetical protein